MAAGDPARNLTGIAAVHALGLLSRIHPRAVEWFAFPLLPIYALFRRGLRRRLRGLPFPAPSALAYYRMRLRLVSLALNRLTGKAGGTGLRIEGKEHYRAALESGRPVALLGWHQGAVELLHGIPPASSGRPFVVLAAPAFAPPLTAFLDAGRSQPGKTLAEPGGMALRDWARKRGVLAVMIDQAPGKMEDAIILWRGRVTLPSPLRLLRFLESRQAVCLPVSALLEGGEIRFRYHPPLRPPLAESLVPEMERALERAPSQYNWSYPKIRVIP